MSLDANGLLTNIDGDGNIDPSLLTNGEVDPTKLAAKYREFIVSSTALFQKEFNTWYGNLLKVPKEDVMPYIDFDYSDWTLETLMPSLFAEVPDPDQYEKERQALNEKIEKINDVFRKYHRESAAILTQARNQTGIK